MKKSISIILLILMQFIFVSCNGLHKVDYRSSGFEGDYLYVNIDNNTYVYEKVEENIDDFSAEKMLDTFVKEVKISDTYTHGTEWMIFSAEEYPDLSYVIALSAIGNIKIIYRAA